MIVLVPLVLGVAGLGMLSTAECAGDNYCGIQALVHMAAAVVGAAAILVALAQWPPAYWLPWRARVVLACVPPVVTVLAVGLGLPL